MTPTARLCSSAAMALCFAAPIGAETLLVTTFEGAGEGSLQAALDAAGASPEASTILVTQTAGTITTDIGLRYDGGSRLVVFGNGVTVASDANVTLFSATRPGVIALQDMTFEGPGGWSIENRAQSPAGKGIFLDVADDATGVIGLFLNDVTVSGVAGHGIHISDCTLADECGGGEGEGGGGEGSDASINVQVADLTLIDVGRGSYDADGLRVDERGPGDILFTGAYVNVRNVGGDGIELDEGQDGDVVVDLIQSTIYENGSYCDPAILTPYLPDPPEGAFREFEIILADLPQPAPNTPDMACFELEADVFEGGSVEEYEYSIDVEDGFDIDEEGPGNIVATISVSEMIGNFDEGFDFDEAGPGDIDVVFTAIIGNGNIDDAIKLSESGPGTLYMTATAVEASSNGGIGIVAEEEDRGDVLATFVSVATSGNDGGALGIEVVQDDEGEGNVYVIDTEIADGIETDGATLDAD